jgi:hypothetical protein
MYRQIWSPDRGFLYHKSVYRTALLCTENAEVPNYTVELYREWSRQRKWTWWMLSIMGRTTLRVSLPSSLFTLWAVAQTHILQINNLTKIFLDCQISNMKIAQVSNDNVDTVRSWSLPLAVTTLMHIFAVILSLSYSTFVKLLRKIIDLFRMFCIYRHCGMTLWPRHFASSRWGWRSGLQTCTVAVNILNKQPPTGVK